MLEGRPVSQGVGLPSVAVCNMAPLLSHKCPQSVPHCSYLLLLIYSFITCWLQALHSPYINSKTIFWVELTVTNGRINNMLLHFIIAVKALNSISLTREHNQSLYHCWHNIITSPPQPSQCWEQCPRLHVTSHCRSCGTPSPGPGSGCSWPAAGRPGWCGAEDADRCKLLAATRHSSQRRWSWCQLLWGPWQSSWTAPCTVPFGCPPICNNYFVVKLILGSLWLST